jgi:hypothetical protein
VLEVDARHPLAVFDRERETDQPAVVGEVTAQLDRRDIGLRRVAKLDQKHTVENTVGTNAATVGPLLPSERAASAEYGSGCATPSTWPAQLDAGLEKNCTRTPGGYDMIVR